MAVVKCPLLIFSMYYWSLMSNQLPVDFLQLSQSPPVGDQFFWCSVKVIEDFFEKQNWVTYR